MKNITPIIDRYAARKKVLAHKKISNHELLREQIRLSNSTLQSLRVSIRSNSFQTKEDEIYFFKHLKPKICGEIKFCACQISFYTEKPNATLFMQKEHIKTELNKLENKKRKNIGFYKYYKNAQTVFDDKYFFRNNGQFNLFNSDNLLCSDPEFNTTHDMLAAEVVYLQKMLQF